LQNYKSTNNIVDTGRGLLNQQQLSDLNTQLISARTEIAEAKARLGRIRQIGSDGIPDATVTDALNNSVITRLRAQYLDLAARVADLASRLGQGHITVVRLHEQMDELRKSIRGEEQRIADAYASDYEIAKAREKSLTDSMYQLVGEAGASSQAQVMMRDLESSADTYRNLYRRRPSRSPIPVSLPGRRRRYIRVPRRARWRLPGGSCSACSWALAQP
jgi:succinoglycan biosynthesis transport protein ExoP